MTLKILILDSDEEMASLIARQLQDCGYEIEIAVSVSVALQTLSSNSFQMLLVDSKIPETSPGALVTKIRLLYSAEQLPILLMSTKDDLQFQGEMRAAGVDDLLARPFERIDLMSKIKLISRKRNGGPVTQTTKSGKISVGDLVLDPTSYDVFTRGARVHLTPNEFKLLHALLLHPGEVLSRDRLIELVQGEGIAVIDRAVDTHVFSLRKKLGECGQSIKTVRGLGYQVVDESAFRC